LLAFELVSDRKTMAPLPPQLNAHVELVEEAYKRRLIIYSRRTRGGTIGDHFMICPPLIVDEDQIAEIMGLLTESLDAMIARLKLPPRSG
jgi:adenosylmethionine-8-amino-7-oxononanoate aminotransferase